MTSSPMVLMTVPLNWWVASFMTSRHRRHGLAGLGIAELVVQLRAADDVGKHDRYFKILRHKSPSAYAPQAANNTTIFGNNIRDPGKVGLADLFVRREFAVALAVLVFALPVDRRLC